MSRNIILCIIFFLCCQNALCVCPVSTIQPVKNIKEQIEKQMSPILEYVLFMQTPTGFVISFDNNVLFDEYHEINLTGKLLLVKMAQIIKNSGYKWQIYSHCDKQTNYLDGITLTTEQAVKITNFITEEEKCLLHQIVPIGFGSMMPVKKDGIKQSPNRTDFIVENFEFSR